MSTRFVVISGIISRESDRRGGGGDTFSNLFRWNIVGWGYIMVIEQQSVFRLRAKLRLEALLSSET